MGKAPGAVLGQETAILGAVTQTEKRGLGKQDTSGRGDAKIQMFGAAFLGGKQPVSAPRMTQAAAQETTAGRKEEK